MRALTCGGLVATLMVSAASSLGAERTDAASYLAIPAGSIALRHVEIIDGTGAAARTDQTLVIVDGRIHEAATAECVLGTWEGREPWVHVG